MLSKLIYRPNRVPYYQRLFQKEDGVRQWWKTPRSAILLYPYFVLLGVGFTGAMWGMGRMVLGKKTWWG